jgi:hypothetical protein
MASFDSVQVPEIMAAYYRSNLLSDGSVYASLEDTRSLLHRLNRC